MTNFPTVTVDTLASNNRAAKVFLFDFSRLAFPAGPLATVL